MAIKPSKLKRAEELVSLLNKYNDSYYNHNISLVPDGKFDSLMNELKTLEEHDKSLILPNSPTIVPGKDSSSKFDKDNHSCPMLSLNNVYNSNEILKFFGKYSHKTLVVQDKVDGMSLSLTYVNGVLVKALTRGDGITGDVVTENAKRVIGVIDKIRDKFTGEIRGEVCISKSDFAEINRDREKRGLERFANARNLASGSMKLLDSSEVLKRKLMFIGYEVISNMGGFGKYMEKIYFLQKVGFKTPNHHVTKLLIDQTLTYMTKQRSSREYEIDGLVIKINDIITQETLGIGSKYPKWAVAYKFDQESVETELLDIIYGVGRTGVITPVALLKPVEILGTMVKRATLHNSDYMKSLGLRRGDIVMVEKGGEIIPQVVSVSKHGEGKVYKFPKVCPKCGSTLYIREEEVRWYCPDEFGKCTQFSEKLAHFSSKKALDIFGLGEETCGELVRLGIVTSIDQLFRLEFRDLHEKWRGAGIVKISKLLMSIQESKKKPMDRWLFGFGIPTIGDTSSKLVFSKYKTWNSLIKSAKNNTLDIPKLGEVSSNNLRIWLTTESNLKLISDLKKLGMPKRLDKVKPVGSAFMGFNIVVTGSIPGMSRSEIEVKVVDNGGVFQKSVTKNTSMLICGENVGKNKIDKAKKSGVKVIEGDEAIEFIQNLK